MSSLLCYKLQCSSCNATYYGKAKRHFKGHASEHMGVSSHTGKNIKSTRNNFIYYYLLRVTAKKCKLAECRTGHVIRDDLPELEYR